MNSIIKTSIKRSVTVCVLVVVLLAVGVLATLDMSTNLLPDIKMPMLAISIVYPGASAESVEDGVTSKVDAALQAVPGITDLQTSSYDNVSVIVLTFDYGTNINDKISDIQDAFKTVNFPEGCYEPDYIQIDMNGTATATVSVYNAAGDVDALTADAKKLASKLSGIEGVGSVQIKGTPEKQIRITALQGLDITALLIVQALSNENLDIPLGSVMQDGTTVSIRNATDATSLLDVMQLPAELSLGASTVGTFATLKQAVKLYAYSTLDEFEGYADSAIEAKRLIDDIEGQTAEELENQQQGLAAVKSLMNLLRERSATRLQLLWNRVIEPIVTNEDFLNLSDEDLRALADDYNLSYDLLKWAQDNAKNGELEKQWNILVDFRKIVDDKLEYEPDYEITYDDFAYLFQDGGSIEVNNEDKTFNGLDLLHSDEYTHDEAVDVCEFADTVNTVAFGSIVNTVREAEEKGEAPEITDAQFAALFVNTTAGNDFAALMSPQVIHLIRQDNFYVEGDDACMISVLRAAKEAHVNENGDPIFKNGVVVTTNSDGETVVEIAGKEYLVNNFGRLVDNDGNHVDGNGKVIKFTDDEVAANYYSYGEYVVFDDGELVELYRQLGVETDMGLKITSDVTRFLRICNFEGSSDSLLVPLAFIGHIEFYDNHDAYAQYNNLLSVTIEVYAVSDANTTEVVNKVKAVLASFKGECAITLLDDKAEFINDSILNVLSSIIIGGVLAVLVIYLFVRKIGSSLVVSITMPLSVLVALAGLWIMGISLNLVSLGGLAVGIGMLVDNSIVVLESITKRRDQGESVFDSCLNGTREVAGSLLASTLTNVCVFFPILFARGLTREIFYDLVWAVLFSIVISLIVAVTVIPSLYHLIYKNSPRFRHKKDKNGNVVAIDSYEANEPRSKEANTAITEKSQEKTGKRPLKERIKDGHARVKEKLNDVSISKMERGYGKILSKVLTRRVLVCAVALVLFGASVVMVFTTGTEFMPGVDKGVIEVDIDFAPSVALEEATAQSKQVADIVSNHFGDKLQYVALTVAKQGLVSTNLSGIVRIQTDTTKLKTSETVQEIRNLLKEKGIDTQNVVVREMDGVIAELTGGMAGQSVTLLGDDMETLRAAAAEVAAKLLTVDPAHIVSAVDNTPALTPQISFTFDRMLCMQRGVDYQTAVMMLRVGMSGYTAANLMIDGESQSVSVQFADATKDNIDEIVDLIVGFDANGVVKLRDVLKKTPDGELYETTQAASAIVRQNGKYSTTISVEIYDIDTGTVGKTITKVVNEVLMNPDYDGVEYQDSGVASYLNDAFEGLVISLVAAFVLLYSVMACQFESLTKPFIVIMSIPFSFTGGFLALAITGMTLNVVSFVGLIMLMGVIVNGAIVMVDKIDLLIREGMQPQEAVVEGCKSRLRPILMTTLTTILALVPLALGLGRGGELMQPMGIVVLGGLLLGTLVTLVLIPCFYCVVKRISFTKKPTSQQETTTEVEAENQLN